MKTNVPVTLSDDERNQLAIKVDGHTSKRKVTRAEVTGIVTRLFELILNDDQFEQVSGAGAIMDAAAVPMNDRQSVPGASEFDEMFQRECGGNFINPILNSSN